jgi:double-stranded uracil-DNA glycosylase
MPLLKDRIGGQVQVLFVGINPGLRSAEVGHHFAGATNRFWRLLFESGLVPRPLTFVDDERLPEWGFGLTNIIARPTRGSSELGREEYARGARVLLRKIGVWRPAIVAPVGISVWRALARTVHATGIDREPALLGLQPHHLEGARVYVLPNPSGRNAHLSYAEMLAVFRGLRELLELTRR